MENINPPSAIPPISTKIEAFFDKLLRLFPRLSHQVTLSPQRNLIPDRDSINGWWSDGELRSFSIFGDYKIFNPGHLYIEGVLHRFSLSKARLFFDNGGGYCEQNSIVIPVTRRGYIREIVKLPPGIVGLQWQPIDSTGYFVQKGLVLTHISSIEANFRMLYRIFYDLIRFLSDNERRTDVVNTLLKPLLIFKMSVSYHHTKKYRVFDSTPRTPHELWTSYISSLQILLPKIKNDCLIQQPLFLISCITHLKYSNLTFAERIFKTLKNQYYQQWELFIVLDSDSPEVNHSLFNDLRVHIIRPADDYSMHLVNGRYIVCLNPEVQLLPHALFKIIQTLQRHEADLVYTDGALTDTENLHIVDLICRPSFSPELLQNYHYIRDLVGFDRFFLDKVEFKLLEASEINLYKLLLRAAKTVSSVAHIPEILYSTNLKSREFATVHKPKFQQIIEKNAVTQTLNNRPPLHIDDIILNRPFVDIATVTKIAIIIPTKDSAELLRLCIDSLNKTILNTNFDIVVIDHTSKEPETLHYLTSIADKHIILKDDGDFNFSKINNHAVRQISGPYTHYLFCNNDVEAINIGWLETMLSFVQMSDVGVVGPKLIYPDRLHIQHAGVCIGLHGIAEHYGKFLPASTNNIEGISAEALVSLTVPHEVSAVTAACMLVRREAFDEVNGFDEQMAVGFGDVDLCLRIGQAGYRCIYSPDSSLIHHESLTRGKDGGDPHPTDTDFFQKRWKNLLTKGDPFYNPAYSKFSYSWQFTDPLPCKLDNDVRVWVKSNR